MKRTLAITTATALAVVGFAGTATADPGGTPNENARACTLNLGGEFTSPGHMFQFLRDREQGAAGTPKDIVDAYPNSFDNVGHLIAQKCQ